MLNNLRKKPIKATIVLTTWKIREVSIIIKIEKLQSNVVVGMTLLRESHFHHQLY